MKNYLNCCYKAENQKSSIELEYSDLSSSEESSEEYFTIYSEPEDDNWIQEFKNLHFDQDKLELFISKEYNRLNTFQVSQFLKLLHFSFYKIKFFQFVIEKISDKENIEELVENQILDKAEFQKIYSKIKFQ